MGWISSSSRDFRLVHNLFDRVIGSWVAVEPNGTGLPSRVRYPPRLGASLPSPRQALR